MAKRKDFDLETAAGAIDAYRSTVQNQQNTYTDPYAAEKANALGAVRDTPAFEFDPGKDPTYQIYQRQYAANAKQAQDAAIARGTALTGGYNNSYAQTAGQQAYNEQMSRLEAIIPSLRQQARAEYDADLAAKYNYLNTVLSLDESGFNRWLSEQNLSRQQAAELLQLYQNNRGYEYQRGRDQIEDSRYDREFDYQRQRDAVADSQWDKTYELNKYSTYKKSAGGTSPKSSSTGAEIGGAVGTYYKQLGYAKPGDFEKDITNALAEGNEKLLDLLNRKGKMYGLSESQILSLYAELADEMEIKDTTPAPNSATYRYSMAK